MRTNVEFKTSDGTTLRGWHYSPGSDRWAQIRDYRDAITFVETLAGVDPKRIGIWGSSCSGGHFGAYVEDFPASSAAARDWFAKYLGGA